MPKTRKLSFRLDAELDKEIEARCRSIGCNKSEYVESLVRLAVEEDVNDETDDNTRGVVDNSHLPVKELVPIPKSKLVLREDNGAEHPVGKSVGRTERGEPVYRCDDCSELFALDKDLKSRALAKEERVIVQGKIVYG